MMMTDDPKCAFIIQNAHEKEKKREKFFSFYFSPSPSQKKIQIKILNGAMRECKYNNNSKMCVYSYHHHIAQHLRVCVLR